MSTDLPIMTIQEMIEACFGDVDEHRVNFKLIESVLLVLAKQLNVLNRHVLIHINNIDASSSLRNKTRLTVSEVKLRPSIQVNKPKSFSGIGKKYFKHARGPSQETAIPSCSSKGSISIDNGAEDSKKVMTGSNVLGSVEDTVQETAVDRISSTREVGQSQKYLEGILDKIEQQREKVLRIIHQRADSHEEGVLSPTPIGSMLSAEKEYEKIFLVETAPPLTKNEIPKEIAKTAQQRPRQLYVVPQDEFLTLTQAVAELQTLFRKYETPEFPNNIQLMKELHKKTSLTDAMSVLQISYRQEASEKAIKSIIVMLTELIKERPILESMIPTENIHDNFEDFVNQLEKNTSQKKIGAGATVSGQSPYNAKRSEHHLSTIYKYPDAVTSEQLNNSIQKLQDEIQNTFGSEIIRAQTNLMNAMKIVKKTEEKMEQAVKLEPDIKKLKLDVQHNGEQINELNNMLSSQLANYQECLTQMENDLEAGLQDMHDTLAIRGGDSEAMSELNVKLSNLKLDFDSMITAHKELKQFLADTSLDILKLRRDVEMLRDAKSDRDEVEDALRDKANVKDLNGMIDAKLFGAVIGDLETRIEGFHKKAHAQEVVWQKVIDDFNNDICLKSDWVDLVSLRNDINKHLQILKKKVHFISDILGEPKAAAVTRKLQRDSACLSCATPAVMNIGKSPMPATSATKSKAGDAGVTSLKQGGGGDHEICYCGQTIPHQKKDFRSELCTRYCGGEHTKASYDRTQVSRELYVKSIHREVGIAIGSDGKGYRVDQEVPLKPCIPCNTEKPSIRKSDYRVSKMAEEISDVFTVPSDFNDTGIPSSRWDSSGTYKDDSAQIPNQDKTSGSIRKTCTNSIDESFTPLPRAELYVKDLSRDDGQPSTPVAPRPSSDGDRVMTPFVPDLIDDTKDIKPSETSGEYSPNHENYSMVVDLSQSTG